MKNDRNLTWIQAAMKCEEEKRELAFVETSDENLRLLRRILLSDGESPQERIIYIGNYGAISSHLQLSLQGNS
jgi:hypothetical protein